MLYESKLLPFVLNFVQSKITNPKLDPAHNIENMRVRYLGLVAAIFRISCAFLNPLDQGAKSRRLDPSSVQLPSCAVRISLSKRSDLTIC